MSTRAGGTFEVQLTPQIPHAAVDGVDSVEGVALGRIALAKQFQGDLVGSAAGEMLSAGGSAKGSAGYVAIERIKGALHGRAGSFVLQHSGTMSRGVPLLSVTVVPDSGTGALAGLAGSMRIDIVDGKHVYAFDYTIGG